MGGGPTFDPDSVKIQKIDCAYPSGEPKFNVTLTMADESTSTFSPDKEQVVKGLSVDGNTLKVSYNGGQAETSLDLPKSKTVTGFAIVDGKLVLTLSEGAPFVVPLPAHTDKFVSSATLSGKTLKLGYNDKTDGPSVDLPKALTNASFTGNVLTLYFNDGSRIPVTIPIPESSDGKYVIGGSVKGNELTLNYNKDGTATPITLPADKYIASGSVSNDNKTLTLNYNVGGTPVTISLPKVVKNVTKDGENLIITYSDGTTNQFNLPAPKNNGVYKGGNGTWYYDDGKSDRVFKRLSTTGINGSATGLNASVTGMNVGATGLSVNFTLLSVGSTLFNYYGGVHTDSGWICGNNALDTAKSVLAGAVVKTTASILEARATRNSTIALKNDLRNFKNALVSLQTLT